MRRGPVVCAGALIAALLALPGCSLVLSFDDLKDAGPAVDGSGDGGTGSDGPGSDPYEPNDTSSQAPLIESGSYGPLPLSPSSDQDWFAFTLTATESDTTIDVLFSQADVDIDVQLLIAGGKGLPPSPIAGSTSIDDNERIERTTASGGGLPPGDYFIRVYSSLGEGSYTLVLATP